MPRPTRRPLFNAALKIHSGGPCASRRIGPYPTVLALTCGTSVPSRGPKIHDVRQTPSLAMEAPMSMRCVIIARGDAPRQIALCRGSAEYGAMSVIIPVTFDFPWFTVF